MDEFYLLTAAASTLIGLLLVVITLAAEFACGRYSQLVGYRGHRCLHHTPKPEKSGLRLGLGCFQCEMPTDLQQSSCVQTVPSKYPLSGTAFDFWDKFGT